MYNKCFQKQLGFKLSENIAGSRYFTWAEALWLPRFQAFAYPNAEQVSNIKRLASNLDQIREHFGAPITITSWLRPEDYNKLIGGSPRSHHTKGAAVDFIVKGVTSEFVRQELNAGRAPWSYRWEQDPTPHVHLDLGGTGGFWANPANKPKGGV